MIDLNSIPKNKTEQRDSLYETKAFLSDANKRKHLIKAVVFIAAGLAIIGVSLLLWL